MKRKSAFCICLCVVLLTAAGCGKTKTPIDAPSEADEGTTAVTTGYVQDTQTEIVETDADMPETAETAETTADETEAFDPHDGLNSTDVAEVLAFYQWAASHNDKPQYAKTLRLVSIDAGSEKINKRLDVFEPIAKKAVAKNSVTDQPLPGRYKTIRPSDWQCAEAVSDGTYTTITVKVAPQTDGAFGKEFEGPVGRSMTVLNGIAVAIDEMPGVSADFENGSVSLEYLEPTIRVKVDNRTGAFVPGTCTWRYRVHTMLTSLDAKVLAFNVHLQNADGNVDYEMSY